MVAGGLRTALGLDENLVKECREEAGSRGVGEEGGSCWGPVVQPCGAAWISSRRTHCYDLELPEDFVPQNTDGEAGGVHAAAVGGSRRDRA